MFSYLIREAVLIVFHVSLLRYTGPVRGPGIMMCCCCMVMHKLSFVQCSLCRLKKEVKQNWHGFRCTKLFSFKLGLNSLSIRN